MTRREYNRFRQLLGCVIRRKWLVAGGVVGVFVSRCWAWASVKKQFFPTSDRPEVLVEVQMPYGTSIEQTQCRQRQGRSLAGAAAGSEDRYRLRRAGRAALLPRHGARATRSLVRQDRRIDAERRGARSAQVQAATGGGRRPGARGSRAGYPAGVRAVLAFPVAFRVMGPDPDKLRDIADAGAAVMQASPLMRTVNSDWGERVPTLRFALDQDRLQSIGLTSSDVAQQLQFLLSGIPITDVREDIRSVEVVARSAGNARLDPARIADFTLVGTAGQRIPLSQIGNVEMRMEDPILRRRDRTPTITVRGDIAEGLQPPDVSTAVWKELQPIIAKLPAGYRIEQGGSIEESGKANRGTAAAFPDHDRPHADHDHLSGPLDLRDDDGVRNRTARPHRRHSDLAVVPAAVRHQRAGRAGRTFRES